MEIKLAETLNYSSYCCNKEIASSFILPYLVNNNNYEVIELYNIYLTPDFNISEVLKHRPLTMIGLDVEGNELEVLNCLKTVIQDNIPILAISAYHKVDDLIIFTDFIEKLSLNYRFYLRKYVPSSPWCNKDELTLYAVPADRCL